MMAEKIEPVFRLQLHTDSGGSVALDLPATEEQMETAKRALGVDEFAAARIAQVEMWEELEWHVPTDIINVEDANALASAIDEMFWADNGGLDKYLAVLSVEQPDTLPAALHLANDLDDYALVPEDAYEYGLMALKRVCRDQEVLDTIDGYMDFEGLGRSTMEADGVRVTEFGAIRRLSSPFPVPEQGQRML